MPCMIGEALTLGAIGALVKDLALDPARDAVREKVKERVGGSLGRRNPERYVFGLYQELEQLAFVTADYVEVLQGLTQLSRSRPTPGASSSDKGEAEFFAQ